MSALDPALIRAAAACASLGVETVDEVRHHGAQFVLRTAPAGPCALLHVLGLGPDELAALRDQGVV